MTTGLRVALGCEQLEDRFNPADISSPNMYVTTAKDITSATDGVVSLREAVGWSNANPPGAGDRNVIEFGLGVKNNPIQLEFGRIALEKDVRILGPWTRSDVVIERKQGVYDFGLFDVNSKVQATFEKVTLRGGGAPAAEGGGAIRSRGTLTVKDCTLNANYALTAGTDKGWGGAIYSNGGTATITDSSIGNNTAHGHGGAVAAADGTLTITNTTIGQNSAGDRGGGVYALNTTVTVDNCQMNNNTAATTGGGISAANSTVTLKGQSKLFNNSVPGAAGKGGGVYMSGGTLKYEGVRIGDNQAAFGDGVFLTGGATTKGTDVVWVMGDKQETG